LGYYAAILALVVAVGAGIGLFALLTAREPGGAAAFIVSEAVAAPCPPGTGAPACYTFDVTNTGNQRGSANCTAVSAEGTTALFANDQPTSQVALLPNETREVYLKVVPTGSDVIRSPSLTCT
ncbi:MAG TPA: hypothetical protein VF235_08485, partial [Actinomycetota bacterium]